MPSHCPHCYPVLRRFHFDSWIEAINQQLLARVFPPRARTQLPLLPRHFSILHWLYELLAFFRIARFCSSCPREEHAARSWLILEEARKRGITVEHLHILHRSTSEYRAHFGSRRYYFDCLPTRRLHDALDDKAYVKKTLYSKGFPVPTGDVFWRKTNAFEYGKQLGFPLVVKPVNGTRSQHVSAPVQTEEELGHAIAVAWTYSPRMVVERYLEGELYRVTVVDSRHVFVARRLFPHVIGDGHSTIAELIAIKNQDPRRGHTGMTHTTLHRIGVNPQLITILEAQGYPLESVPESGRRIVLAAKRSCGAGGDLLEETGLIHPKTAAMFRAAAKTFDVDLVGFDFIARDIRQTYDEQPCGIIEANSLPFIDFHVHPTEGQPQPIVPLLWESILADASVHLQKTDRPLPRAIALRQTALAIPVLLGRSLLNRLKLTSDERQPFRIGSIRQDLDLDRVIARLKCRGFELLPLAWYDRGQLMSMRRLLDRRFQCHVRVFEDREVRAHIEYAPEVRPLAHLFEHDFRHPDGALLEELEACFCAPDESVS